MFPNPLFNCYQCIEFFTSKKTLKRPFKAILKPVKHLSLFTYPHSSFTLFCPALSEIKNEKLFIHIPTNPLDSPFFGVVRLYSLTLFFSFFFSDYSCYCNFSCSFIRKMKYSGRYTAKCHASQSVFNAKI